MVYLLSVSLITGEEVYIVVDLMIIDLVIRIIKKTRLLSSKVLIEGAYIMYCNLLML